MESGYVLIKVPKQNILCWNNIIFNASKDLEIKYLQNITKTFERHSHPRFLLSKRIFTQLQEIWLVILVTFILYCEKEKSFVPINSHNCLRNMFGLPCTQVTFRYWIEKVFCKNEIQFLWWLYIQRITWQLFFDDLCIIKIYF